MKKITKKEKIILGVSVAVGAGLVVYGMKQKIRIDNLSKSVTRNTHIIDEIVDYIQDDII